MKHLIVIAVLSIKLLISFVYAECCEQNKDQTLFPIISIANIDDQMTFQNPAYLISVVSQMLQTFGYDHDSSKITLYKSQKNHIAVIETGKGKKFVKIKKRGEGLNEYLGTLLFKNFAPIIPTEQLILSQNVELVVQPFIAEVNLLFHNISELEVQDNPDTWKLMNSIFLDALKLSSSTMRYAIGNAKNDEFFFNRLKTQAKDGISGRIEHIYKGKTFKLIDLELSWEELKTLNWSIDGIAYQETLEELLTKSRLYLDSNQLRLIGMSHGNWHENNILINKTDCQITPYEYAYIALEFAGENDLIADAVMFLTHTTVYADYLNSVYYSKAYGNDKVIENVLKNTLLMKERLITLNKSDNKVNAKGVGSFGTLNSRKKIANLFNEQYFHPLVGHAVSLFGEEILSNIDNRLQASLLLRLLGGQDISKMIPQDQMKMIGLIYQSVGTPITSSVNKSTIHRFIHAL